MVIVFALYALGRSPYLDASFTDRGLYDNLQFCTGDLTLRSH